MGTIPSDLSPGREVSRHFHQVDSDPRLGAYRRKYIVRLPADYTGFRKVPSLFYFHGWGEVPMGNELKTKGFVIVQPQGMADGGPSSWNLGTANRTDTCNHKDVDKYNYTSCFKKHVHSICNCGTCYDDYKFIVDLIAQLQSELCIEPRNMYASGASFGALLNYYSAPALASRFGISFRAILPWYGAFYQHTQHVILQGSWSVFHFHGVRDTEVPPNGGESGDGYFYVPVNNTLQAYATAYSCDVRPVPLETPFDGQGTLLGCEEWHRCTKGRRVVRCLWNEEHGFWPTYADEMMEWFMTSVLHGGESAEIVEALV